MGWLRPLGNPTPAACSPLTPFQREESKSYSKCKQEREGRPQLPTAPSRHPAAPSPARGPHRTLGLGQPRLATGVEVGRVGELEVPPVHIHPCICP